jgi:glycosyltransferase involved in cell wall biosynthesis
MALCNENFSDTPSKSRGFRISVITATYNASEHLSKLIESLRSQTEKNFEWIVADGGSTDGTVELLRQVKDLNVRVVERDDFGIYDALNHAIRLSSGDYYVVIGADDFFYENALADFMAATKEADSDIYTAKIKFGKTIRSVKGGGSWLNKQFAYVSSHSVGTLFRKSLHVKYGYYSAKYPIAADQYFILKACSSGANVNVMDSVVGEFTCGGVSSTDVLGNLSESLRIQICFHSKYMQIAIFFLKLVKNFNRI